MQNGEGVGGGEDLQIFHTIVSLHPELTTHLIKKKKNVACTNHSAVSSNKQMVLLEAFLPSVKDWIENPSESKKITASVVREMSGSFSYCK